MNGSSTYLDSDDPEEDLSVSGGRRVPPAGNAGEHAGRGGGGGVRRLGSYLGGSKRGVCLCVCLSGHTRGKGAPELRRGRPLWGGGGVILRTSCLPHAMQW
eukprot:SAG22_NODE_2042_length_3090_cov_9.718823_3_plen_101_part_00